MSFKNYLILSYFLALYLLPNLYLGIIAHHSCLVLVIPIILFCFFCFLK